MMKDLAELDKDTLFKFDYDPNAVYVVEGEDGEGERLDNIRVRRVAFKSQDRWVFVSAEDWHPANPYAHVQVVTFDA